MYTTHTVMLQYIMDIHYTVLKCAVSRVSVEIT